MQPVHRSLLVVAALALSDARMRAALVRRRGGTDQFSFEGSGLLR